jgi:hypothetical protein
MDQTAFWIVWGALIVGSFLIVGYTDAGQDFAAGLSAVGAFFTSAIGGFFAALLLSYPANGCADLQCETILGWATISEKDAAGFATAWGLLLGGLGVFLRFIATARKFEREKNTQRKPGDHQG